MGLSKKDIKEKIAEGYLLVRVILEVVGGPKEHVDSVIKQQVDAMKAEKTLIMLESELHEAEPQEALFIGFAELEFLIKSAKDLAYFCFDYMPSSIEIIEPENFTYKAADFTNFFNDLQAKLHQLNGIVKNALAENKILSKNAALLLRNNIIISLKEKNKDISTLSKNVGIPQDQLKPFLEKIIQEGYIKKQGELYCIKS